MKLLVLTFIILLFGLCGCQIAPTGETSKITEVVPMITPEESSDFPHEMEGHENCIKCHFSEDEGPVVSEDHHCIKCHEMTSPFHFDHGDANEACIICHFRKTALP